MGCGLETTVMKSWVCRMWTMWSEYSSEGEVMIHV